MYLQDGGIYVHMFEIGKEDPGMRNCCLADSFISTIYSVVIILFLRAIYSIS